MVKTGSAYEDFESFLPKVPAQMQECMTSAQQNLNFINQVEGHPAYATLPAETQAQLTAAKMALSQGIGSLEQSKGEMAKLAKYSEGVNLLSNQSSLGIAPIIGVDWKMNDKFNFAAKYEFKTQIRMENESTVFEASEIGAVNKFRDSEKVNEDIPALLTIGARWNPIDAVNLNLGWHHYFDKNANWYNNSQDLLRGNTNEYLAGVEWDVTDKLNVSCGAQLTRYGLTDEYMNDMSFVVNSYSFGFGFSYKVKDNITLSAAYFQTNYDKYTRENYPTVGVSDTFTRTNRVLGLGCQLDF